ncbi:unnamed protein product [Caenorhabditis sp. 36 PRJEB53466]|nr:unnamed protein product [Caenorhabditis sp. 36 PRJEB53466]
MEIDNLEGNTTLHTAHDLVSLLVIQGNLCYTNTSGVITKLEDSLKVLECSPLLAPVLSCSVIQNRIHVVSVKSISSFSQDSPLDYESYEAEKILTHGQIKMFGETRLMIYDKASQTCFIWETDRPKSPSHLLCFGPSEFTVDVACDENNLYSLTTAGVVSVWKLRPNGRKYRDRLFTTFLSHCSRLLLAFPQKFVILTASEVHFVVFGTDSDGQQ